MKTLSKGDWVSWYWGQGTATGQVEEIFFETVTKTLKGSRITRKGTPDNPAYLLVQEKGNQVLKLHSEVSRL